MFELAPDEARLLLDVALMATGQNRFQSAMKILAALEPFRANEASLAVAKAILFISLQNFEGAVAYIDGEYTLKEFKLDESGECAWLIPHNPDFQPIRVDKNNEFSVWGVVTYAIHKTRL